MDNLFPELPEDLSAVSDEELETLLKRHTTAAELIDSEDEEFIQGLQKQAEVDEAEETETPLITQSGDMAVVDDSAEVAAMEQMSEEDLLRKNVFIRDVADSLLSGVKSFLAAGKPTAR